MRGPGTTTARCERLCLQGGVGPADGTGMTLLPAAPRGPSLLLPLLLGLCMAKYEEGHLVTPEVSD